MLRGMLQSRVGQFVFVIISALAVWKINDGDITKIVDSFLHMLDVASDYMVQAWNALLN